ncbi:MAG: GNAT family N-acetyltransferase, partial [Ruminiclostridium sp.]|nr:GNAT family N-acetyltransferase [Ruminiclostridium sp.]
MNVYKKCPILENDYFLLRYIREEDAEDLLKVYSDKKAVLLFNSDNCNGDIFYYTTLERMKKQILFWDDEYNKEYYVRWSIIDKKTSSVIGTIELFNRKANDFF